MPLFHKRIEKEITRLQKKYTITIEEQPKERYSIINLWLYDKEIKIKCDDYYPFTPPAVTISNISYIYIYRSFFSKYKKLCEKYATYLLHCPCCSTILCEWSPSYKIDDILLEMGKWEKDKLRIMGIFSYYVIKTQLPFDNLIDRTILTYI